jgi:opacity protein-like surface antigen
VTHPYDDFCLYENAVGACRCLTNTQEIIKMKTGFGLMLAALGVGLSTTVIADDDVDRFSDSFDWYGSVSASYLNVGGDLEFFGNTASVYGGTPTIDMDDGGRLSLAFGIKAPQGWRLEGDVGYLTLNSDADQVFGLDDRAEDSFSVDAEIESLVFMLNGIYDFDIGNQKILPYVKAGVGVARNKATQALLDVNYVAPIWDGSIFEGESLTGYAYPEGEVTEFVWNVGAGLRLQLSRKFSLAFEYGFTDLGEAVTGTDENGDALGITDLNTQQLTLGLTYDF